MVRSSLTRLLLAGLLTLMATACTRQAPGCGALTVEQAWIRAVPAGMDMTAGYLSLRNPGPTAVRVTGFASRAFGHVTMHRTRIEAGQVHMRPIPQLLVPAGGSVVFAPGGRHLMLAMAQQTIRNGDTVPMHLSCGEAQLVFTAEVRNRAPGD